MDGGGNLATYSLRTFCRALEYARQAGGVYGAVRALWDGMGMAFATCLDEVGAGV